MLRHNLKLFLVFISISILLILFKNGQIFDLGVFFRNWLSPQISESILKNPPDDLEAEYQKLLVENNQLKVLREENEELRSLLDFKNKNEYQLQLVNILSRDPVNRNILIVDAGQDKNIENGQAVVVGDGIIVGKIFDVGIDSAKVRLLTDNFSKLAVRLSDDEEVSGILSGSLGLAMDLSFIPQEKEIKKGDMLLTADIDNKIPAGLVVGQVEEVEFSQEELFKNASVLPLLNYDSINILAVITNL